MLDIYRMHLSQILGGRMKWLAVTVLLLPVLLTLALVGSGVTNEIQREVERESGLFRLARGDRPESAEPLRWNGEDREFLDGDLLVTRRGVFHSGRRLSDESLVTVINGGRFFVLDGVLWIDHALPDLPSSVRRISLLPRIANGTEFHSGPDIQAGAVCAIYLFLLYPQVICLLLALFYGTSVLGSELSGKTLTYLFTRPLPRWQFVTGKYLAIITALVPPACVSVTASWLILGMESDLGHLAGYLVGTAGALIAYTAVFILFGFLVPRRAMIAGILYGVVFEFILSFTPALVNRITVTYYLRSFVAATIDVTIPQELAGIVGGASPQAALLALSAITVTALLASSLLAVSREYVVRDQA